MEDDTLMWSYPWGDDREIRIEYKKDLFRWEVDTIEKEDASQKAEELRKALVYDYHFQSASQIIDEPWRDDIPDDVLEDIEEFVDELDDDEIEASDDAVKKVKYNKWTPDAEKIWGTSSKESAEEYYYDSGAVIRLIYDYMEGVVSRVKEAYKVKEVLAEPDKFPKEVVDFLNHLGDESSDHSDTDLEDVEIPEIDESELESDPDIQSELEDINESDDSEETEEELEELE